MDSTLLLIDAYSQIFRAYYAVRQLTDSRGEPVNALFGFAKLLFKLEREYPTCRGALVFDCGRVKFRLDLIPEYKANRKPTPEDLKSQVPPIRELAAAFGWPIEEEQEYEADDLIGALACHYDGEVRIISADKDLSQLICGRIAQLVPVSGSGFELRSPAEVREKFGVGPELVVDYLALLGDASDNIPGAEGIGVKGAAELLNSYGPLLPLLEHPEQVKEEKRREKLVRASNVLRRNIELIRLKTDLPQRFKNDFGCRKGMPDRGRIEAICRRYELNSLLRELDKLPDAAVSAPAPAPVSGGQMVQDDLFNF